MDGDIGAVLNSRRGADCQWPKTHPRRSLSIPCLIKFY